MLSFVDTKKPVFQPPFMDGIYIPESCTIVRRVEQPHRPPVKFKDVVPHICGSDGVAETSRDAYSKAL